MKKYLILLLFLVITISTKAQQYGLFNTKTTFDAFENPAQKHFTLDSSRQYSSTFLFPYLGLNFLNKGSAQYAIRKLTQEGVNDTRTLNISSVESNTNTLSLITNAYIFTYRIFKDWKYQKELGFAWQIRSDAMIDYSNETLSILDSYKRFEERPYNGIFNNKGAAQTYHQFSVTYRENLNKKIAFGAKLSLLSGIQYNGLDINKSSLFVDGPNDRLSINIGGTYRGTFINKNEIGLKDLLPFKNFGFSTSLGASYTSKSGYFMMGNIKDLGFIRWGKDSHTFDIDYTQTVKNITTATSNQTVLEGLFDILRNNDQRGSFTTLTNAKADFLISKTFGIYRPSLIVSKNIYNKNGDVALVNTFTKGSWSGTFVPTYNLNNFLLFGLQGMFQTPNYELFLGTDNIFKTYYTTKGILTKNADIGNGYNGASVYFGMAIKFGYVVEHPQNRSWMPKIDNLDDNQRFFPKLLRVFKKKQKPAGPR